MEKTTLLEQFNEEKPDMKAIKKLPDDTYSISSSNFFIVFSKGLY